MCSSDLKVTVICAVKCVDKRSPAGPVIKPKWNPFKGACAGAEFSLSPGALSTVGDSGSAAHANSVRLGRLGKSLVASVGFPAGLFWRRRLRRTHLFAPVRCSNWAGPGVPGGGPRLGCKITGLSQKVVMRLSVRTLRLDWRGPMMLALISLGVLGVTRVSAWACCRLLLSCCAFGPRKSPVSDRAFCRWILEQSPQYLFR